MHLFVIHQFPDLDNLAPIIHQLSKKDKVFILSCYPIYNFKYFKIFNFLTVHNDNINFIEIYDLNKRLRIFKFIIFLFRSLPKPFLKKLGSLWRYIYYNNFLINNRNLYDFLKKKNFSSINVDDALPQRYCKVFFNLSDKLKIKFFTFKNGVDMRKKIIFRYNDYSYCKKIIIQDNHYILDDKKNKNVIKSCHRYCLEWIKLSENAFDYKMIDYKENFEKKKKLKIVIFTRSLSSSINRWDHIYQLVKSLDYVDVKIKYKPRGNLQPLEIQNKDDLNNTSSELINWCDLVISHTSSVLVEAILKKKGIIFLDHLTKLKEDLLINDYSLFNKVNSDEELIDKIKNFKNSKLDKTEYDKFLINVLGENYKDSTYLEKLIDKLYF